VPPLLPEYLSQPVNIVIQTGSSNWSGPMLSLGGVALGAGLAYLASRRVDAARIKLEKLEEIAATSAKLEKQYAQYVKGFLRDLYVDENGEVCRRRESGRELDDFNMQIARLDFMMLVHFDGRDDLRKKFRNNITGVNLELALIATTPQILPENVDSLKHSVRSMLRHIELAQKAIHKAAITDSEKLLKPRKRWRTALKKLRSPKY